MITILSAASIIGVGGFFAIARALTEQRLRVIQVRNDLIALVEQQLPASTDRLPDDVFVKRLRSMHVGIRHAIGPEKEELLAYIQRNTRLISPETFIDGLYDRFDLYTVQHLRNYVRFAFTGKRRTH